MAVIENITSEAELIESFTAASDEELFATDLVQRGAIDALEKLIEFGVSKATVDEMLESIRYGRGKLLSIAARRGVVLIAED